jgi:hypothetical protein
MFDASATIADARAALQGEPVFLAGSLCAAEAHGKPFAFSDVDVFCPTSNLLIATAQKLLSQGFTLDDRMTRVWARWLRYGTKGWHTNSLRMSSPQGQEYNLVYKLADGHPTTSLSQVLESFDFGLLGVGIECEDWVTRDLRPYLFPPPFDIDGPLPLMPNKRSNWRHGFISQYNGLRECGRYVKYHTYGYDLSSVKDDLVTGYFQAEMYYATQFDPEKQMLGQIYGAIGNHMDVDNIDELTLAYKQIDYNDSLDVIMAALE